MVRIFQVQMVSRMNSVKHSRIFWMFSSKTIKWLNLKILCWMKEVRNRNVHIPHSISVRSWGWIQRTERRELELVCILIVSETQFCIYLLNLWKNTHKMSAFYGVNCLFVKLVLEWKKEKNIKLRFFSWMCIST